MRPAGNNPNARNIDDERHRHYGSEIDCSYPDGDLSASSFEDAARDYVRSSVIAHANGAQLAPSKNSRQKDRTYEGPRRSSTMANFDWRSVSEHGMYPLPALCCIRQAYSD
jgi:hypothetical protein